MGEILFDNYGTSHGTSAWLINQWLLWLLLQHEADLSLIVNQMLPALMLKTSPL
jgi:hypothetical protein